MGTGKSPALKKLSTRDARDDERGRRGDRDSSRDRLEQRKAAYEKAAKDTSALFKGESEAWENRLTGNERGEVWQYTVNSNDINKALRKGIMPEEGQYIDSAIAKFNLKNDIYVSRKSSPSLLGLKSSATASDVEKAGLIGAIVTDKAYVSTSAHGDGIAINRATVQYRIKVPKGKGRGAYVEGITSHKGEFEFLLKRNTSFIIKGARDIKHGNTNILEIDMEVVT